jgi:predicted amidohydrolase
VTSWSGGSSGGSSGGAVRIAAAAARFGRDLAFDLQRVMTIVQHARDAGAALLVLPDGALGGHLPDLRGPDPRALPPALAADDPLLLDVAHRAGAMVVCLGYCELAEDGGRFDAAVALCGDGVLGRHRKVHRAPGEADAYRAGDGFAAFDTPVGRLGMLVDYDKVFPESARALAVDGAYVIASLCAWPTRAGGRSGRLAQDRQARLFDLYDCARAAENQVVLASANQTGSAGGTRYVGQAKVVGPGGEVLARTWAKAGLAVAEVDVGAEVDAARRGVDHLAGRRPGAYGPLVGACR